MNSISYADDIVKEYLFFRGFTNSIKAFDSERRSDKLKSFQVDKLQETIQGYLQSSDLKGLKEFWLYLSSNFYGRVFPATSKTVIKMETSLWRCFIVIAYQKSRIDKISDFFQDIISDVNLRRDFEKWMALLYLKNPESDPYFSAYFSKSWQDLFYLSLNNFLDTVFRNLKLPTILNFNYYRLKQKELECEIDLLKGVIENLKLEISTGDKEIFSLRKRISLQKKPSNYSPPARSESMRNLLSHITTQDLESTVPDGKSQIRNSSFESPSASEEMIPSGSTSGPLSPLTPAVFDNNPDPVSASIEDQPLVIQKHELFNEHNKELAICKFSPEGSLVCSADIEGQVRVWSHVSNPQYPTSILNLPTKVASSLSFDARSDKIVYIGSNDNKIRIFNTESSSVVHELQTETPFPIVNEIAASPSTGLIVSSAISQPQASSSSSSKCALMLWNIQHSSLEKSLLINEQEESLSSVQSLIHSIQFNHNGQLFITGDSKGNIRVFDTRTLSCIMSWHNELPVEKCYFSFDENNVFDINSRGQLTQWSLHKPGEAKHSFLSTENVSEPFSSRRIAMDAETEFVLYSNNSVFATINSALHGQVILSTQAHEENVTCVEWPGIENLCMTGAKDGSVLVHTVIKM